MKARQLLAHLSIDEALALARQRPGATLDEAAFRAWWDASQIAKAARADTWSAPTEQDLPGGCEAYVAEVTAIPQAAAIGLRPWAIKIVDLRQVVGFQIPVFEDRIRVPAGLARDPCSLLPFTLQKSVPSQVVIAQDPGGTVFTVTSADVNVRVAGQVQADVPLGKILGFIVGGGLPWMQVVVFNGRHILRDGYHRAVGLLRAGVFEVPVARIEGAQIVDLGIQPGFFPPEIVLGPQPPLLTDFLDDALSQEGEARALVKIVRITADQFVVAVPDQPAAPAT